MKREHTLPTPEDTRALGTELAGVLRPGDLVVLVGPLGAGKTALTQGIGAGLGVSGRAGVSLRPGAHVVYSALMVT